MLTILWTVLGKNKKSFNKNSNSLEWITVAGFHHLKLIWAWNYQYDPLFLQIGSWVVNKCFKLSNMKFWVKKKTYESKKKKKKQIFPVHFVSLMYQYNACNDRILSYFFSVATHNCLMSNRTNVFNVFGFILNRMYRPR